MNYIITKHPEFFDKIGKYNFCELEDMILPETLAIDTETTGLFAKDCDIFCVQIGTGDNNYLIHCYDDNYEVRDIVPYIDDKTLVFQNGLFDLGFFYKYNFYPEKIKDTMLATKILLNGKGYMDSKADFQSIMKRELDVWYDKTTQKNIHIVKLSVDSAIMYSFNDVDRLVECHDVLQDKINQNGFTQTYDLHCRFIRALAYMEQCGIPISSEKWSKKMDIDKDNALTYTKEIEEYIYDNLPQFADRQVDMFSTDKKILVKITSPLQMIKVFNALGIKTKDKDGKDSINESIISKTKHEFVDLWLKYQNAHHRVTTFGKKIYDRIIDKRLYTNFNPMVETARLSSRRGGINFLNFPSDKNTRDCFTTQPGNKMIVCDYGAQEGVIMADLSGDEAMTASVVDGVDLHCLLAKAVFPELEGLSDDVIATKHKDKRTFVKPIRFAFSYGGNGYTIYQNLGVPLREGERIYSVFRELHAGLYEWGDEVYEQAIKKGYIESVDGWRLWLNYYEEFLENKREVNRITREEWLMYRAGKQENERYWLVKEQNKNREEGTPEIEFMPVNVKSYEFYKKKKGVISSYFKKRAEYQRLCLNNPVQTRGAHQLKLALCYIFEWIVENGYINIVKICNAIHDEVVLECPENLADLVRDKVQYYMKLAGDHYLKTLPIKADAAIGDSWYEAK
jgi:DNA polymerase I-like protein with 3'-5' exonuclease and polymerase domains